MKLSRLIPIVAATLASLTVVAVVAPSRVTADRYIDCNGLAKWNSDKAYKKGDVVYSPAGGMNHGAKYKCKQDKCLGVGANQPYHDNGKTWEFVAACESSPK